MIYWPISNQIKILKRNQNDWLFGARQRKKERDREKQFVEE